LLVVVGWRDKGSLAFCAGESPKWLGADQISEKFCPKDWLKAFQFFFQGTTAPIKCMGFLLGWCQDNGNRSNQESKIDFLATRQELIFWPLARKIDEGQQKIKIVRTN